MGFFIYRSPADASLDFCVTRDSAVAKHIVPCAEGGSTLIAQDGDGGNVMIIDLNQNGVPNWACRIPFLQSGTGQQYMGFGLGQTKDKLYFLFNDHNKNHLYYL